MKRKQLGQSPTKEKSITFAPQTARRSLKRPRKTIRRSENGLQLGRGTILWLGDAELTEHVAKINRTPEDKKDGSDGRRPHPHGGAADHHGCAKGKGGGGDDESHAMGTESMSQCPMMTGMKGMNEKSEDAQKELK